MASSEVVKNPRGARWSEKPGDENKVREERRAYNRRYMRRWRADPHHTAREQLNRRRAYHSRKLRTARTSGGRYRNLQGEVFCAFCRKRPSTTLVTRLKSSVSDALRYVEIRMPYCGDC